MALIFTNNYHKNQEEEEEDDDEKENMPPPKTWDDVEIVGKEIRQYAAWSSKADPSGENVFPVIRPFTTHENPRDPFLLESYNQKTALRFDAWDEMLMETGHLISSLFQGSAYWKGIQKVKRSLSF